MPITTKTKGTKNNSQSTPNILGGRSLCSVASARRGKGARAADEAIHRVDRALHAAIEVAGAKLGPQDLVEDSPRHHVAQHGLEAVAHLEAHLPIVLRDEKQRAVVLFRAAELPRFGDPKAVLFELLSLQTVDREHDDLRAFVLFERCKRVLDSRFGRGEIKSA